MSDDRIRRAALVLLIAVLAANAPVAAALGGATPQNAAPQGAGSDAGAAQDDPGQATGGGTGNADEADQRGSEGNGTGPGGERGSGERAQSANASGSSEKGKDSNTTGSSEQAQSTNSSASSDRQPGAGAERTSDRGSGQKNGSSGEGAAAGGPDETTPSDSESAAQRGDENRAEGGTSASDEHPGRGSSAGDETASGRATEASPSSSGTGPQQGVNDSHGRGASTDDRPANAASQGDEHPGEGRTAGDGHPAHGTPSDAANGQPPTATGPESSPGRGPPDAVGGKPNAGSDESEEGSDESEEGSNGADGETGDSDGPSESEQPPFSGDDGEQNVDTSDDRGESDAAPERAPVDAPRPGRSPADPTALSLLAVGAATAAGGRGVEAATTTAQSPATLRLHLQTLWEIVQTVLTSRPQIISTGAYSHHDDAEALDHDARDRLHRIVGEDPGVNVTTLAERADLTRSTARYHLRVLEQTDVLASAKISGKRRYFQPNDDDAQWYAALRDQTTTDVIEAIDQHEPASGSTLASELDRDPSTVSHHLDRLEEAGLIERERDGRAVVNRLTAAAREALTAPAARESADRGRSSAD